MFSAVLPHRLLQRLSLAAALSVVAVVPHPAGSQTTQPVLYGLSPERRALLDTIRFAEGTWRNGQIEGYRTLYGGSLFNGLERHPQITVRRQYTSAAAGAYQFLPDTWREVAQELNLQNFGPRNQDQAALRLIDRRDALELLDQGGFSPELVARLAPEWASLPGHGGGSHYGQPVKSYAELAQFYGRALQRQLNS